MRYPYLELYRLLPSLSLYCVEPGLMLSVIRLSRRAWALMQAEAAGHKKRSSGGVMCSQKLGACTITEARQVSRHWKPAGAASGSIL